MVRRSGSIIWILFIFSIFLVLFVFVCNQTTAATLHVGSGQPYATIQDAINNSDDDDTVYVHAGTYFDYVNVNKTGLTLQGENRATVILDFNGKSNPGIEVSNQSVLLTTFSVKNQRVDASYSIKLSNSNAVVDDIYMGNNSGNILVYVSDCTIQNCILDKANGIFDNIRIDVDVGNTIIYNNRVNGSTSRIGIEVLSNGDGNSITYNWISNCSMGGVECWGFGTGTLTVDNNTFTGYFGNNPITMNDPETTNLYIRNNDIINVTGVDEGCIYLYRDCGITDVSFNSISTGAVGVGPGIYNLGPTSSTFNIYNNTIERCTMGIYLAASTTTNNIYNNIIMDNNQYGIYIHSDIGGPITIYNNYLLNYPVVDAYDPTISGATKWNTSKTLGTNIIGGTYLGGNYWGNYTGTDSDGDGIGDVPYTITTSYIFDLLDTQDDGESYWDIWGDGTYIYAACGLDGVRAYSFDGSSFILLDTQDDGGNYYGVGGDGTYIYTACGADGVRAYSFDGSSFTLLDTQDDGGSYWNIWGDGTYIYTACGLDGVRAYTFDGANFVLKATQDDGNYFGVGGDGTYIYTACGPDGVRAYSFDGSSFILLDTQDDGDAVTGYFNVWSDGTYVFASIMEPGGEGGQMFAYTFDGADFVLKDTVVSDDYWDIWGDGTYIYTACGADGVRAYSFDGSSFALLDTQDDDGKYYGVGGDDTYIFTGCTFDGISTGIRAYNFLDISIFDYLPLVQASETLTADFSYTPSNPKTGDRVKFIDLSIGTIVEWHWNFGDGSTSIGKNQNHVYDEPDRYKVILTVTSNLGATDSEFKYVTVTKIQGNIKIPPLQPPLYPLDPYTIPEMYQLLRGDKLPVSNEEIIVVVIDTGSTPRMFNNTDMNDIILLHHPSYNDGLDDNGHGTAVNCIVHYALKQWTSNSVQYSIKALDKNGACTTVVFLECLDMAKDLNPHIITVSVGAIGHPYDVLCQKIDELRREGIIVTAAGGNFGPTKSTILSPACGESALAIGSIDPRKTILDRSNDIVSIWSSRGPVLNIFPKPDMVAPGESILVPYRLGEIVLSGTSLSTPFVAAGSMLLYSNNRGMLDAVKTIYGMFWMKYLPVQIVEESLAEGGFDKGGRDSYGWGIVDIEKANEIVFWKCLFWLLLFVGIIAAIIITILVLYRLYKKQKE